ncbi:DNA repair protein [Mycena indigotica]|uniref:Postreplication repair E3 ubiquitin-protein ligase RAD18 n=1 Tax=Mycena indigotica TaxID=2126181 RepID=A0A8H6S8A8_9AGAR|nr:DNA repair protein [Mycena indigotica]KAF7294703.1 DNA repair protein [Mycena indigotica]
MSVWTMNPKLQAIEDPTDFPPEAKSLQQLDAAVRCSICSEFFDGPVSLQCGHSFCSLCIRNTMATTSQSHCPTCRAPAKESHLRPNSLLEDIVSAWKPARAYIVKLAKQDDQPARKKRRLDESDPPSSAGPSRTPSANSTTVERTQLSSLLPMDAHRYKASDSLVACPLCKAEVPMDNINYHIDSGCATSLQSPKSQNSKAQWSSIMGPKSKGKEKESDDRVPKLAYDTLTQKQLRERLERLGLLTTGDHSVLVARHQQWAMLWNANLDKSTEHRESKEKLRRTLRKWESERHAPRKEKPAVDSGHLKKYSSEFKRLTEAARVNKAPLVGTEEVVVVDSEDL